MRRDKSRLYCALHHHPRESGHRHSRESGRRHSRESGNPV